MRLNTTPRGARLQIALFGRRNAGKSSLINALTGQEAAIVSEIPGTTTDPVTKAMEIPPLGPVLLTDTAGLDDDGALGAVRKKRSMEVINRADLVLLVVDPGQGFGPCEREIITAARRRDLPVIVVTNKTDRYPEAAHDAPAAVPAAPWAPVSARTGHGIDGLIRLIIRHTPRDWAAPTILGDLIGPGDTVVLVIPIDKAAPKGRLILPQQQVIRDILDHDATAVMVKDRDLPQALRGLTAPPKLVVADASAYPRAVAGTPDDVLFTSFSILFARHKGDLGILTAGAKAIDRLRPGDRVLIAEACTHHPVADDIGRVKIPRLLTRAAGGDLSFDTVAGGVALPENLGDYQLVVHCGACMLNRRQMLHRLMQAREAGVPIVNYGVLLAHVQGMLRRALSPFPAALSVLDGARIRGEGASPGK